MSALSKLLLKISTAAFNKQTESYFFFFELLTMPENDAVVSTILDLNKNVLKSQFFSKHYV